MLKKEGGAKFRQFFRRIGMIAEPQAELPIKTGLVPCPVA